MADGRHFKNVKSPYLSEKLSDFDEIWCTTSDIEPSYSHLTKNEIFGIQDGGNRHLEIRSFLVITHRPIVRFRRNFVCGSRTSCRQTWGHMIKTASFQNPTWQTAAIWKSLNCHIPLKMLFDFWQNLVYYIIYWIWWGFQKRYRRILDVIR